uniref:Ribosomal protein L16 n=1 Tax=Porolithon onkodes TaxID=231751 RepID=A0A2Z2KXU2_9FLOR|nr:ribosomal protein L16 [Porolithon onkodes]ASB29825.1 ribosomal protein L16 [Porolithon onkodes]
MMTKKTHKKTINNLSYYNHLLKKGSYGFKIMSDLRLTEKQIISLERNLKIRLKKLSIKSYRPKIWMNVQLNRTLTKLNLESRMGKGKGSIYTRVIFLKKGSMIYEFANINTQQIMETHMYLKKYVSAKLKLVRGR